MQRYLIESAPAQAVVAQLQCLSYSITSSHLISSLNRAGEEGATKEEGSSRTERGNVIDLKGDVSGQALDKVPAPSPTLQTLLQPIDPAVLPKSG